MMSKSGELSERTRIKAHFKQDDFDFFYQWILGSASNGGIEIGECLYAAAQIEDGNPESWQREWTSLAERVEARAKQSLEKGHTISASDSFLRAYTYHRAPLLFMSPKDPAYLPVYERARACFREAIRLRMPAIDVVEIPFEDKFLPGYFIKASDDQQPRPTLLMFGGGDTCVEDMYAYIGPSAVKRGYNVVIADLPGQGLLPHQGMHMPAATEIPMKAIVDFTLDRPDVDPERLAAFGISAGGYLIPRAATVEKRIKATIASSAIFNFYEVWTRNTNLENLASRENSFLFRMLKKLKVRRIQTLLRLVETYQWRWGANSISDLIEKSKQFVFDPRDLKSPVLILIGEQEYVKFEASRGWAERCVAEAPSSHNRLVITPQDEGADGHAIGTNVSLMAQEVFDWLDEVFA
jgi:alpha-beta hydrolase superfamily lysophospholipase